MTFRYLEVTVNLAEDLKNLRHFSTMDLYVVVSLSGDESNQKRQTRVLQDCGKNPRWGQTFSFKVDEARALAGVFTLKFEIKDEHTFRGHMDVGWVEEPVRKLLEQGGGAGDGEPKVMRCEVRLPSGMTKGVLEFSYKFGERFTEATPPSTSSSAAGCPLNAGPSYPPQGIGYQQPGKQRPTLGGFMPMLAAGNFVADISDTIAGNDGGFHDCLDV